MTNSLWINDLRTRWIAAAILATVLAAPSVHADDAAPATAPAADATPMTPAEKKKAALEKAKEAAAAKKAAAAEKAAAAKQALADKKAAAIEKAKAAKAAAAEKAAAAKQAAADKKAAAIEKAKAAKEAAAEKAAAAKQAAADKKAAALEKIKAAKEAAAAKKAAALQAIADKKAAALEAKKLAAEEKLHPPGTLTINATADAAAVQIELTDPAGNKELAIGTYDNKHAKPGTWKLAISATAYGTQKQDVEVKSKEVSDIKVALKKALGVLSVTGTPAGATVRVKGPSGFTAKGALPFEAKDLAPGKYEMKISSKGMKAEYPIADVKVGETASVSVELKALPSFPGMVRVPGGTFEMGSVDGDADEKPVTKVTLPPFFIDKNDVTVAEYAACAKTGKCQTANVTTVNWAGISPGEKKLWSETCNWGQATRENHPMNCIDWESARTYCEAQGARLPTEAEWELAARGTDGRKYPWGNQPPDGKLANACGPECSEFLKKMNGSISKAMHEVNDNSPTTSPVGSFPAGASPYGALDMAGNVWQWVADGYAPYAGGEANNPQHPSGKLRVDRGGGWKGNDPLRLRSALRDSSDPESRVSDLGFRCARSEPQEAPSK